MNLLPKTAILVAILYQGGGNRPIMHDNRNSTDDPEFPVSDGDGDGTGLASPHMNGVVVGTLELSFTASTRTHFMTLNAPPVSR